MCVLVFLATSAYRTGLSANGEVQTAPDDTGVDSGSELDVDTEPDTGTELDTGTEPDTEADIELPPPEPQACFLGGDGLGQLCLDLVAPGLLPNDYAYPLPFQGSPQFREPRAFIDLGIADLDLSLAPNFQLFEFATTDGHLMVVQPESLVRLQAIRDVLGPIVVELGYRSPTENRAAGSGVHERYIYGDGFRIRATQSTPAEVVAECWANGAGFVEQLGLMVHCDWRNIRLHLGLYYYP